VTKNDDTDIINKQILMGKYSMSLNKKFLEERYEMSSSSVENVILSP